MYMPPKPLTPPVILPNSNVVYFKIRTFLKFYRKLTVVLTHSSTPQQKPG
jgi:hypothetical protein